MITKDDLGCNSASTLSDSVDIKQNHITKIKTL